jgi:peroxiredoxin Q/BCP
MPAIQVGDHAPSFEVVTHSGKPLRLADYAGKQVVVVYFYPRDNTPGCTTQACSFRDAYEDFVKAGAVVIGISSDSTESHQEFAATKRLPFELVSDPDNRLRKLFGVPKTLGLLPGRVTYVIDREGIVRLVFNSQLNAAGHVAEALKVVQELAK